MTWMRRRLPIPDSDTATEGMPAAADGPGTLGDAGRRTQENSEPGASPAAAPGTRKRRRMPESTRRIVFIIAGVFVFFASVLGFYLTSDVFDDRTTVLVAARDIEAGEILSAADFGSDLVLAGSVPNVPWTPEAPLVFEGKVALQPIPEGVLVRQDMFTEAETVPVGVELEVVVPLDLSLVTDGVFEGKLVLLVDPGAGPVDGDDGRPRQVVREFKLTNFDGSQMRLFLPPEEWAEWEALLEDVGGTLIVVDLGVGAAAEETTQRLDAVWGAQWSAAVEQVAQAAAAAAAAAEPEAGPDELEVIVSLDAGLVPTGVAEGDLVLLVDPGAEPLGNDPGRARSVIGPLRLENYSDGRMRMFVGPEEWQYWRSLPDELGAAPMVLPVAEGSDVDGLAGRLDAVWLVAWEKSVAESGAAP